VNTGQGAVLGIGAVAGIVDDVCPADAAVGPQHHVQRDHHPGGAEAPHVEFPMPLDLGAEKIGHAQAAAPSQAGTI
jgi:hypothetical protein